MSVSSRSGNIFQLCNHVSAQSSSNSWVPNMRHKCLAQLGKSTSTWQRTNTIRRWSSTRRILILITITIKQYCKANSSIVNSSKWARKFIKSHFQMLILFMAWKAKVLYLMIPISFQANKIRCRFTGRQRFSPSYQAQLWCSNRVTLQTPIHNISHLLKCWTRQWTSRLTRVFSSRTSITN